MVKKKTDLAIVNRGFWEDDSNKVIGEALLDFSERVSENRAVCVITQSRGHLRERLNRAGRGNKVRLLECRSHTTSSNGLVVRALDTLFFAFYVFFSLIRCRPKKVYVSTDPPIVVPFFVFLYCKLASAEYYYHLQDIHPEATNIVVPLPRVFFSLLQFVDALVSRHAQGLITLSEDMAEQIKQRGRVSRKITLIDNPAGFDVHYGNVLKSKDFVFCGNAGRVQRIPMLYDAIRAYCLKGGTCHFTFIGGGVNSRLLKALDNEFSNVSYLGPLPPEEASTIIAKHRWALLPIDDDVTRYAFPSKSSTYLLSGCRIFAICSRNTSVGKWVLGNGYGVVCEPQTESIVQEFFMQEKLIPEFQPTEISQELFDKYSFKRFSESLSGAVFGVC